MSVSRRPFPVFELLVVFGELLLVPSPGLSPPRHSSPTVEKKHVLPFHDDSSRAVLNSNTPPPVIFLVHFGGTCVERVAFSWEQVRDSLQKTAGAQAVPHGNYGRDRASYGSRITERVLWCLLQDLF